MTPNEEADLTAPNEVANLMAPDDKVDISTLDEKADLKPLLSPPPCLIFTNLVGNKWFECNDEWELKNLGMLLTWRCFNPNGVDWNFYGAPSQPLFVFINQKNEQDKVEFLHEILLRINWKMPYVTVVFSEWTIESRRYRYDSEELCYQSWYEHLGYIRTAGKDEYVKHAPSGWLPNKNGIWGPPGLWS